MTASPDKKLSQRFHEAGRRLTSERKLLLRIIDRNAHCDASELFQLARAENPRIGIATVYRTLHLLEEMGMIHSSGLGEDHTHYEISHEPHVHLVCTACGTVLDLPSPDTLNELEKQSGFRIERTTLELFGLCPKCQAKETTR